MIKENDYILTTESLYKEFKTKKGVVHAVDGVDLAIRRGETLGLVGESGCGKSTLGRVIVNLIEATSGKMEANGEDIINPSRKRLKQIRKNMQIVFQDPYSSLDPRMNVKDLIQEPLRLNAKELSREAQDNRVLELMDIVGLSRSRINAYPHELDGGRRQRIGIARALSLNPSFLVLDEPVSALDVCIQAQILNLLKDLQNEFELTYLFITHDLSVVHHVSDRIAVMYLGKIVEIADYKNIFTNPSHPYTQALLSAISVINKKDSQKKIILEGDVPSPINPPPGCRFEGRCFLNKTEQCRSEAPPLKEIAPGHFAACYLIG
ncbi:MAG: ATP-binding cassette domain-containing protein [Spirochaetales bacterium]|nr:ATP-binding cassette domain-containing protein [Spirochaetales bacterium]